MLLKKGKFVNNLNLYQNKRWCAQVARADAPPALPDASGFENYRAKDLVKELDRWIIV
jgi:hypothetical protein